MKQISTSSAGAQQRYALDMSMRYHNGRRRFFEQAGRAVMVLWLGLLVGSAVCVFHSELHLQTLSIFILLSLTAFIVVAWLSHHERRHLFVCHCLTQLSRRAMGTRRPYGHVIYLLSENELTEVELPQIHGTDDKDITSDIGQSDIDSGVVPDIDAGKKAHEIRHLCSFNVCIKGEYYP